MSDETERVTARRGALRFRPTPWATVFTILGMALLVGLGTWQLQRLEWKESLIAERHSRSTEPAVPLPADLSDTEALDFTRVVLVGRFLNDRELYLGSRTMKGAVGYHVVTPFRLSDGRSILVDRGWVPQDRRDPTSRPGSQIEGDVRIEALLRPGGWHGWTFTRPVNDAAGNIWLWLDLPAMFEAARGETAGLETAGLGRPITSVYAEALPRALPGGLPISEAGAIDLRNDHLQYALTWYALALALLVIYLIYSTRRGERR